VGRIRQDTLIMVVYSPILILQGRSFFIRGHFPGIQGHTHQRRTQGVGLLHQGTLPRYTGAHPSEVYTRGG